MPQGQFCDKGSPYRTAIFFHDDAQKQVAEASKPALEASGRFKQADRHRDHGRPGRSIPAEDYHQDYYKKNASIPVLQPSCGRAAGLEQIWGPPTKS